VVPLAVLTCLLLSQWQWHRYEARKQSNAIVSTNTARASEPVNQVIRPGGAFGDAQRWRTVTATGTYDSAAQVLVRRKPLTNTMGFWVATPLVTQSGRVLVVNRGWIAAGSDSRSTPAVPAAPPGVVSVTGRVHETENGPAVVPSDIPVGQAVALDVARIGASPNAQIYPAYLDLVSSTPAQSGLTPIPLPELDNGPHLSYTLQWIAFAIMFVVGLGLLVRREYQLRNEPKPAKEAQVGEPINLTQDSDRTPTAP